MDAKAARAADLIELNEVVAGKLSKNTNPGVAAECVVADRGEAGITGEPDALRVGCKRIVADRVAIASLVGV